MLDTTARKARVRAVMRILRREFPDSGCSLDFVSSYHLLVAVILSAQCTDKRVNQVTPRFFELFPSPEELAAAPLLEIEEVIHSTGFYHNKAKSLKGMAGKLVSEHGGRAPDNMKQLLALPGVGRKTANVILGEVYKKPEGVVVDTHVMRLSRRLGLADSGGKKNAVHIERELNECITAKNRALFGHMLIDHGRKTCRSRSPRCGECKLIKHCEHPDK